MNQHVLCGLGGWGASFLLAAWAFSRFGAPFLFASMGGVRCDV